MADRFYGIAVGGMQPTDVTEQATTTSKAVELRISDTAYANKMAVLNCLEALRHYVISRETTPIA